MLHSDNGSPMKGATMLATLQRLGVMPSFSRPSVSDDNPYAEALFKTLKYHPGFPDKPFDSLAEARSWVKEFQQWDNEIRRHSALKFVTVSFRQACLFRSYKKWYIPAGNYVQDSAGQAGCVKFS